METRLVWIHVSGVSTETENMKKVKDIVDHLNSKVPDSTYSSAVSELLRGLSKYRKGWSIKQ